MGLEHSIGVKFAFDRIGFDHCEACIKRIALQTSVYFTRLIEQLTFSRRKQLSRGDAGNSIKKGLMSCGCEASLRRP